MKISDMKGSKIDENLEGQPLSSPTKSCYCSRFKVKRYVESGVLLPEENMTNQLIRSG